MTTPIFTTRQFNTAGGILGLDRSAVPRVVLENRKESTADGEFVNQAPNEMHPLDAERNPDLKLMIDQRAHWRNDYGVAVQAQVMIQRSRRTMYTTAPNYAFIRESYTTRVGVDSPIPIIAPAPDLVGSWQTEWGGGIDVGIKSDGDGGWLPNYGQFRLSTPESSLTAPLVRIEANQSIDIRFRAALITPYRWWDNIPDDNRAFQMYAFSNTIRLMAFPEPYAQ